MVGTGSGIVALTGASRPTSIIFVAETGSTNVDVLASDGGPPAIGEGQWLVADRQSAGRGRLGRTWQDGIGNFMGSTIVLLGPSDPPAPTLALVAGVAVMEAIRDVTGPTHAAHRVLQIKWPNDIMAGEAKLGGILLERAGQHVAIGVGINLVSAPPVDGRATAAIADIGACPSRDSLAIALQSAFSARIHGWRNGDWPEPIISRWMAMAHPPGTRLTISEGAHAGLTGTFDGLEQDGSLRLRSESGAVDIIRAGEVRLAPTG